MSSLEISIIVHSKTFNEEALDFMLAASNLTDNIAVFFIAEGVGLMNHFKALKGFDINAIYAERAAVKKHHINLNQCALSPQLISRDSIRQHVTHCQQLFTF